MSTTYEPASSRGGQLRSAFTGILEQLCAGCVGALAATLIDEKGESVDLAVQRAAAAALPGYLVKLAGAHLQIVMRDLAASSAFRRARLLTVAAEGRAYVVMGMPGGYVVVLVCERGSLDGVSSRALRECEEALCREADWELPHPSAPTWRRLAVQLGRGGLPRCASIDGAWTSLLEPAGALEGLGTRERGVVLRTAEGAELRLVREPSGHWYAEGRLDAGFFW